LIGVISFLSIDFLVSSSFTILSVSLFNSTSLIGETTFILYGFIFTGFLIPFDLNAT